MLCQFTKGRRNNTDGRLRCPRPGCGCDRVMEEPSEQLRQWLCLRCEERFDIKTGTVFEGTRYSLRTILWAAYFMLQMPFGVPSLELACLLEEEERRLSHKDSLDNTHGIQTALIESCPRFAGPAQGDHSLMGYARGVEVNVLAGVDTPTRQGYAEPIYGPVNQANSSPFFDKVLKEDATLHSDSSRAYEDRWNREKVNHAICEFVRNGVSTNLDENMWSTFQEMLYRRRAVTATYLPLYLAEYLWRYNHRSEPILDQLRAFIRNAHDVVLRGDDKPCDATEVEKELAVQLALSPPPSRRRKARNNELRSRIGKQKGNSQMRIPGV